MKQVPVIEHNKYITCVHEKKFIHCRFLVKHKNIPKQTEDNLYQYLFKTNTSMTDQQYLIYFTTYLLCLVDVFFNRQSAYL